MKSSELDESKEDISVGKTNQFKTIILPSRLFKQLIEQPKKAKPITE